MEAQVKEISNHLTQLQYWSSSASDAFNENYREIYLTKYINNEVEGNTDDDSDASPIYDSTFQYTKDSVSGTLFYIIKGIPKYIRQSGGLKELTSKLYFHGLVVEHGQKHGLIIGEFYLSTNQLVYYCWIQARSYLTASCPTCGNWEDEWVNEPQQERIHVVLSDSLNNLISFGLSKEVRNGLSSFLF